MDALNTVKLPVIGQELETGEVIKLCESLRLLNLRDKILNAAANDKLPPNLFKTDGASCCPEELSNKVYIAAVIHDLHYWFGGTEDERLLADYEFGTNIIILCQLSAIESQTMFEAVRIGGKAWMRTPWSWGYGWL